MYYTRKCSREQNDFDQKLEEVILVRHYDLFLRVCGGHDSKADSLKQSKLTCFFSILQLELCKTFMVVCKTIRVPIRHNG